MEVSENQIYSCQKEDQNTARFQDGDEAQLNLAQMEKSHNPTSHWTLARVFNATKCICVMRKGDVHSFPGTTSSSTNYFICPGFIVHLTLEYSSDTNILVVAVTVRECFSTIPPSRNKAFGLIAIECLCIDFPPI
jgi:hypothetical protein